MTGAAVSSGVPARLYLAFGGLVGLPFALALAAWMGGTGSLSGVVISGAVLAVTLLGLAAWRLEVSEAGIRYRGPLGGTRAVDYGEIERAAFESARGGQSPRHARFRLTPRGRAAFTVSLRAFPQPVVAAMFAALRQHGVTVEVPAQWHAEFIVRQEHDGRAGPLNIAPHSRPERPS